MATVYRVEDPSTRIGPYNSDCPLAKTLAWAHSGDMDHPSAPMEFGRLSYPDEKFAFSSMRQLFAWFGGWLPVLIKAGFRVTVYRDVRVTASGNHQVMFRE